jgi:hypothetical protein
MLRNTTLGNLLRCSADENTKKCFWVLKEQLLLFFENKMFREDIPIIHKEPVFR